MIRYTQLKIIKADFLLFPLVLSFFNFYLISSDLFLLFRLVICFLSLLFLFGHLSKKNLFNISLMYSILIIISGIYNYYTSSYYSMSALLSSLGESLIYYCLYCFGIYYNKKNKTNDYLITVFLVAGIVAIITFISCLYIGTANNSNVNVYPYGNKFTSSYILMLFTMLYGTVFNKKPRHKIIFVILQILTVWFCYYLGCITALISSLAVLVLYFMPDNVKNFIKKPTTIILFVILSGVVTLTMASILNIPFINNIVFNYFDKSITVTGRLLIYGTYFWKAIGSNILIGNGFYNYKMASISHGMFTNAQNGLLQIIFTYGMIGAIIFIILIFDASRKSSLLKTNKSFPIYMLLYALIFCGIFEITFGDIMVIAICLIRWLNISNNESNLE